MLLGSVQKRAVEHRLKGCHHVGGQRRVGGTFFQFEPQKIKLTVGELVTTVGVVLITFSVP